MSDPADSTALPISTVHADAQATECNATMITVGSGAVSLQLTGAPRGTPEDVADKLAAVLGQCGFQGVVMVDPDNN